MKEIKVKVSGETPLLMNSPKSMLEPEEGMRMKTKKQDTKAEAEKVGRLRAGNSGLYIREADQMIGSCPRKTRLRMDGINSDQFEDLGTKPLMFQAGLANEDQWDKVLEAGWVQGRGGTLKREEEIGIKWETRSGISVTGRPDIVLCDSEENPVMGIELKMVCSLWTARDVLRSN